jgi:hypothetical protein
MGSVGVIGLHGPLLAVAAQGHLYGDVPGAPLLHRRRPLTHDMEHIRHRVLVSGLDSPLVGKALPTPPVDGRSDLWEGPELREQAAVLGTCSPQLSRGEPTRGCPLLPGCPASAYDGMYSLRSAATPTLLGPLATCPLMPTLLRLGLSTLLCRSSPSLAAAPTRAGIHYDEGQCYVSFDAARLASPTWRRCHDDDPLGIWGYLQSAIGVGTLTGRALVSGVLFDSAGLGGPRASLGALLDTIRFHSLVPARPGLGPDTSTSWSSLSRSLSTASLAPAYPRCCGRQPGHSQVRGR